MLNFKKAYHFKIIAIAVSITFFCTTTLYPNPISKKEALRIPSSLQQDEYKRRIALALGSRNITPAMDPEDKGLLDLKRTDVSSENPLTKKVPKKKIPGNSTRITWYVLGIKIGKFFSFIYGDRFETTIVHLCIATAFIVPLPFLGLPIKEILYFFVVPIALLCFTLPYFLISCVVGTLIARLIIQGLQSLLPLFIPPQEVVQQFSWWTHKPFPEFLIKLLKSWDKGTRIYAIQKLGGLRYKGAIDVLIIPTLSDDEIGKAAKKALEKIKPTDQELLRAYLKVSIELLRDYLETPDPDILKTGRNLISLAEQSETIKQEISQELVTVIREKPSKKAIELLCRIHSFNQEGMDRVIDLIRDDKKLFAEVATTKDIISKIKTVSEVVTEFRKNNSFDPTAALINMALSSTDHKAFIKSLEDEIVAIKKRKFNPANPLHVELGYVMLQRLVRSKREIQREISYQNYLNLIEQYKKNGIALIDGQKSTISTKEEAELTYLAYEALKLKEFINGVREQARKLGLPLVVIENRSYGTVALSPIKSDLEREGIKIISTKVGSTDCHDDPFFVPRVLLDKDDIKFIVENRPIVIMVDGSSSVTNQDRSLAHYPDAYQGYRNYFIAVNEALEIATKHYSGFGVDEEFLKDLRRNKDLRQNGMLFSDLVRKMNDMVNAKIKAEATPYRMDFWYAGHRTLHIREHKRSVGLDRAPPAIDPKDINQPTLIIAQTCLEYEAIPSWVKEAAGEKPHDTGYYDDKDNFTRFYLYLDNSGPNFRRAFKAVARIEYKKLNRINPERQKEPEPSFALPERNLKGFIFDLDGVLALLGQPISPAFLERIKSILATNRPIAIITEEREENLEERAWSHIPENLRQYLHFFSNGGTIGFGFDASGKKVLYYHFKLDAKEKETVLKIIDSVIEPSLYKIEPRDYKVKIRISHQIRKNRQKIAQAIEASLKQHGLDYVVTFQGTRHINIFKFDKAKAGREFLSRCGLNEENILIIGDQARSFGPDRKLLTAFPKAISINVGSPSPTINRENPTIIQTGYKGLGIVKDILDAIKHYLQNSPQLKLNRPSKNPAENSL